MPLGKTAAPKIPPREVLEARLRLNKALATIASMPIAGASNINVPKIMEEADRAAFARPERWQSIIDFQTKAEAVVRSFPMPRQPTWADVDKAVDIMERFMYDAIVQVGGASHVSAGIATGWVSGPLHTDQMLRAQLPVIYTRLRLNLLGLM